MASDFSDLPLFVAPPAARPAQSQPKPLTRRERFENFDRANPEVMQLLRQYAAELKARGLETAGFRLIWERARWALTVEVKRPDGEFRLNDHLSAEYSRELMRRHPEFAGMFETRERDQ
jgi:hypothetical protein